jgi:hypothetical protein
MIFRTNAVAGQPPHVIYQSTRSGARMYLSGELIDIPPIMGVIPQKPLNRGRN